MMQVEAALAMSDFGIVLELGQTRLHDRASALLADPSRLIVYGASTPAGDTTRSDFILNQLTSTSYSYSSASGVGSATSPYKGTLLGFTQQFTSVITDKVPSWPGGKYDAARNKGWYEKVATNIDPNAK